MTTYLLYSCVNKIGVYYLRMLHSCPSLPWTTFMNNKLTHQKTLIWKWPPKTNQNFENWPSPPSKWPVPLRVINNQPLEIFLHVCVPLEFWNPTFCITNCTKIILNKSIILRTSPWQSRLFPWLPQQRPVILQSICIFQKKCCAVFSRPEHQSETTYIERPNNIFVKQTKYRWSRSLPNTTASSWNP